MNSNTLEAFRIIYFLVRNPSEGKKKKRIFDEGVGLLESCLESVPSVFIFSVIVVSAGEKIKQYLIFWYILLFSVRTCDISLINILVNHDSHSLFTRIFGLTPSRGTAGAENLTTYVISIISASLGLAKCLKNGVATPIAPGGALDGLLTGKFLLAFLSSGVGLLFRALCLSTNFVSYQ